MYLACNLLTLGVGLWKCKSMGLLPTGTGDWLAFEARGEVSASAILNWVCDIKSYMQVPEISLY